MPLTLYSFIINRKSGFVKAFLRSRSSSAKQTILIAATICRRGVAEGALPYARGRFLVEAAIGCEADDSYVSDDLPQLPALLTSVSNSIAGSVLPPSLGRGGASLAEGATHLGATCFFPFQGCIPLSCNGDSPLDDLLFPVSGVRHLILQWRLNTG